MTEEEAKAKWCAMVRFSQHFNDSMDNRGSLGGGNPCACIASACALWVWDTTEGFGCVCDGNENEPLRCVLDTEGMTETDCIHATAGKSKTTCGFWRAERQGHCGLINGLIGGRP